MIQALLFDLDGTLIETDTLHAAIFAEMGREHGIEITRERYDAELQGRMTPEIFADLLPGCDAEALGDEKEARFRDRLGTDVVGMPGLAELLDWARRRGLATAVVTNAPGRNAAAMLAAIGVADRFDAIVVSEELARGKPDPLPYLTAAERLAADPARCIAFEDSRSGVRAARAAGAHVFGLRSTLDDAALRAAGAHATITDFRDPALWAHLNEDTE